jgi:hypothetical protein
MEREHESILRDLRTLIEAADGDSPTVTVPTSLALELAQSHVDREAQDNVSRDILGCLSAMEAV